MKETVFVTFLSDLARAPCIAEVSDCTPSIISWQVITKSRIILPKFLVISQVQVLGFQIKHFL